MTGDGRHTAEFVRRDEPGPADDLCGSKPYYEADGIVIYHADCRSLQDLPGPVAAVVTSPPYNVGIEYDEHDDNRPWTEYWTSVKEWTEWIAARMEPAARAWINTAPVVQALPGDYKGPHSGRSQKDRVALATGWTNWMGNAGLSPADTVAWCSMRGSGTAWGSYQSPSAPNLRGDWEQISIFYKGTWARQAPAGMESWRDELGGWPELVTNVWRVRTVGGRIEAGSNVPQAGGPGGHPAAFPLEIPERCIRLSTWPGETVLDPFMGSGSTLVAAKRLGRKAIGIDISERYCEIAAKRLDQGVLDLGGVA